MTAAASKESRKSIELKVGRALTLNVTPKSKGNSQSPVKKSSDYLNEYLKSLQKNGTKEINVRGKGQKDATKNKVTKARKEFSDPLKYSQKQKFEAPKYIERKAKTIARKEKDITIAFTSW